MSVSISIDKPDVTVSVADYDGYTEAGGVSAPLVMGEVQSTKGDDSVASGIASATVLGGVQSTKGDGSVAGGSVASVVAGDAQSQKGASSQAEGVVNGTAVGDVTSEKGDATQADGMALPVVMGQVQTEHLKPTHRWQMLLPRNFIEDSEVFTSNSDWRVLSDAQFNGPVDNVGPNGETAYEVEFTAQNGKIDNPSYGVEPFVGTRGFLIRAVDTPHDIDFGQGDKIVSLTTDWQWAVKDGEDPVNGRHQLRSRASGGSRIYLLKAFVHYGLSRSYTTRTSIAQTIPDVVAGADLENGSQSGADTNDLDFGVDSQGVPYAVSDGDDKSSPIPNSVRGSHTWVTRFYAPNGDYNSLRIIGDRGNRWVLFLLPIYNELKVEWFDVEGVKYSAAVNDSNVNYGGWNTVTWTIDEGTRTARINANGTATAQTTASADFQTYSGDGHRVFPNGGVSGFRIAQLDALPVLTPAEAEAVRQRLAGNPSDPIAKTEAWDLSAETSPHNLFTYSEDIGDPIWDKERVSVNSDVVTAPDGTTSADKLVEDTSDDSHQIRWGGNNLPDTAEKLTYALYAKPAGRDWVTLWDVQSGSISATSFDVNNGVIGQVHTDHTPFMAEVGDGWYKCGVSVPANDESANISPRIFLATQDPGSGNADSYVGDGSSGLYIWGLHAVMGEERAPPYAPTNGSIASPQTVPSLRGNNDLTLGSDPGADTNDGSWIAPIGMAEDGDDQLRAPTKRPTVTWIERVKYTATRAFGRNENGWKVTATDLVVEDTNGNTASTAHGKTINDGAYHTVAVTIDEVAAVAEVYIDGATSPDATVDLSTVGTLKSSDVELLAEGGTIKQPAYYTRTLTGDEIAYLHERLVDNPESAFPTYALP